MRFCRTAVTGIIRRRCLRSKNADAFPKAAAGAAGAALEEIPLIVKPDGLWFYATDFSPYVLTWEEKAEPSANTGESAIVIVVMAGLFALSLAGAGFVAYRRRKLTAE